ncbi:MAG: AMP-binding protein [Actinomycetota bacterium]
MSHNIYELFATKFADAIDAPFLTIPRVGGVGGVGGEHDAESEVTEDAPGEPTAEDTTLTTESLTYRQVDQRSVAMAAALAQAGATPGDRIVVQVDKSADAVALYLACLRAGLVFVPLNTAYTPEEVGFFLGDADPAAFVYKSGRGSKLLPVAEIADVPVSLSLNSRGGGTLAQAADANADAPATVVERGPDDVACMVYTSGTTGRSKGAMLTNAGIATNARALHAIWRFRPGDVLLHCLPIFHIHGLFVALHCAMLNGSEVLFLPRFDVDDVRALLPRATVMMGVPTHYARLLADPDFGPDGCADVRLFTCGSAPLSEPVFHEFIRRTGHTICERYGMTETGIIASNPPEGQRIAGTVGFALPEMEMRVADEKDEALGPDEIGEVQVRGPHLFAGYWGLENKTAESNTGDGFFKTGDIGSMAADGRLTLAGRSSDMIISGGYNVYPKEIELALDQLDGVSESAVVGLNHPDFGEAVTAFVVADLRDDHEPPIDETALRDSVEDSLANFKRPKRYIFLDELPRNSMGKVQKANLRETYAELYGNLAL